MDSTSAITPTFNLFIYNNWWVTQLPFIATLPGGLQAEQGAEYSWPEVPTHSAAEISPWMEILKRDEARQTVTMDILEQAISPPFNK